MPQERSEAFYQQQINLTNDTTVNSEDEILKHAVLRLNGQIIGIVFGIICALVIFIATNWLVLKGGDDAGHHLILIREFFFGYSVTFTGSLIGALYGFLVGYVSGWLIGLVYNAIVYIKIPKFRG